MTQCSRTRSRAGLVAESVNAWSTVRKSASDFAPLPSSERRLKPPPGGGVAAFVAAAGTASARSTGQLTGTVQVCGG